MTIGTNSVPGILRGARATGREADGRGASSLHTYRLVFPPEGDRIGKAIEFDARDPHEALLFAQREQRDQPVELYRDGTLVCRIRNAPNEVWQILPGGTSPPA